MDFGTVLSADVLGGAFDFPGHGFFLDGFAFVDQFFTLADAKHNFGATLFQVNLYRNAGKIFSLSGLLDALYFLFVQKQFAFSERLVVRDVAEGIEGDFHLTKPRFPVIDANVGFGEIATFRAQGLDFRAFEADPALDFFQDLLVVIRLAVGV